MKNLEQLPLPLLIWYRENARELPWRQHVSPYHTWVSEIMLQQTRVAAVLGYYTRFLEELPTIADLANCPEERLMKLWQGLGYYSRVRNLQKAAIQILETHGGEFPENYSDIRNLTGIGDYTAGAIASIAFGQPHPAVDGNVLRVVARITGDFGDITTPAMKKRVTAALYEILPIDHPGDFNQGMMELGATICLPNGAPLCDSCPAKGFCVAYATEQTGILPVKAPKKSRRIEERAVYLMFSGDKIAIRQRPKKGLLAGLWEYPNCLVGEAICPQLTDRLANKLTDGPEHKTGKIGIEKRGTGKHIFTHIEWHMTAYLGEISESDLPEDWILASRQELAGRYAIPNAFDGFLPIIQEKLGVF